jgi:hypothetical protein
MPIQFIVRRSSVFPATAKAGASPFYVDSDDNTIKTNTAATGTTEAEILQHGVIAAGSALTLTKAAHEGRVIALDTLAGSTVTLPTSSGSGAIYRFVVSVLATSNSHIVKVGNATDIIQGVLNTIDTDTAGTTTGWATAATDDTITLNRTTTGSAMRGEWFEIIDIASGVFVVRGQVANTGVGATPFSATV